jgi:hypothetical protein
MEVTPEPERKRRRVATKRLGYSGGEDDIDEDRVDGSIYIGMVIRKKFGRKYFRGQVISGPIQVMNKSGKQVDSWHVQYEDNDEEDLEVEELLPLVIPSNEPYIGMEIRKKFDDGEYYQGQVVSGPTDVEDISTGNIVLNWQVVYEDGQMEDLSRDEINLWTRDDAKPISEESETSGDDAKPGSTEKESSDSDASHSFTEPESSNNHAEPSAKELESSNKKPDYTRQTHRKDREAIKKDLKRLVSITEKEIDAALDKMKPPYGMNRAVQLIHEAKDDYDPVEEEGKFYPHKGLRIRKNFKGVAYWGTVTADEPEEIDDPDTGRIVNMWEVREGLVFVHR